ncbi:MAG: hypothetical protein KDC24_11890 [Saprospiraceae bacterium]|nr:hypothetical protein [Saprospiraceae bacterium]
MHTKLFLSAIVAISFFLSPALYGQSDMFPSDTIAARYDKEVLSYSGTWFFKKAGEKVNLGFFAENLRKEVNDFEASKIIFEDALKSRRTSLVLNLTGLGLLAAGAVVQSQDGSRDLSTGLYIAGIVGLSASIPFSFKYNERLHESIEMHNKLTLLQPLRK